MVGQDLFQELGQAAVSPDGLPPDRPTGPGWLGIRFLSGFGGEFQGTQTCVTAVSLRTTTSSAIPSAPDLIGFARSLSNWSAGLKVCLIWLTLAASEVSLGSSTVASLSELRSLWSSAGVWTFKCWVEAVVGTRNGRSAHLLRPSQAETHI